MKFKVVDTNKKYFPVYFRTKKEAKKWVEEQHELGTYQGANLVIMNR